MKKCLLITSLLFASLGVAHAQQTAKPEDTEVYEPVPPVVTPGKALGDAPTDALVLFDSKNLDQWVLTSDTKLPPAGR